MIALSLRAMGKLLRFDPKRRRPRKARKFPPARFKRWRRSGWMEAWVAVRPFVLLIVLATLSYIFALPGSNGAVKDGWDRILAHQLDSRHRPCNFVELMPRLRER